jgi:hypothetical protein
LDPSTEYIKHNVADRHDDDGYGDIYDQMMVQGFQQAHVNTPWLFGKRRR